MTSYGERFPYPAMIKFVMVLTIKFVSSFVSHDFVLFENREEFRPSRGVNEMK